MARSGTGLIALCHNPGSMQPTVINVGTPCVLVTQPVIRAVTHTKHVLQLLINMVTTPGPAVLPVINTCVTPVVIAPVINSAAKPGLVIHPVSSGATKWGLVIPPVISLTAQARLGTAAFSSAVSQRQPRATTADTSSCNT